MKIELNQLRAIFFDIIYDLRNNRYCFCRKTWSVDLQSVLGHAGEWLIHAIWPLFSGETPVIFIKGEKSSSVIKMGVMDINPTNYILNYFDILENYEHYCPKVHLLHMPEVILQPGMKAVAGVGIFEAKVNCLFHCYVTLVRSLWQKYTDIQGAEERVFKPLHWHCFLFLRASGAPGGVTSVSVCSRG